MVNDALVLVPVVELSPVSHLYSYRTNKFCLLATENKKGNLGYIYYRRHQIAGPRTQKSHEQLRKVLAIGQANNQTLNTKMET